MNSIFLVGRLFILITCGAICLAASPLTFDWEYQTEDRGVIHTDLGSPPVPGAISGAAVMDSAGRIYFGSWNSRLYCLGPNGETNWVFKASDGINYSPALAADGTIYFGTGDGKVYALNSNGTKKWAFTAPAPTGPVLATDGTIYFGSNDANLYALNPDGTLKWKFLAGATIFNRPAVGNDGTIYFSAWDHKVYAVNPDGTSKWTVSAGPIVTPGALVVGPNGIVYAAAGGDHKQLLAISPRGAINWFHAFEGGYQLTAPAIGSDGTLYLADDTHLYALDSDGALRWAKDIGYSYPSKPILSPNGVLYLPRNCNEVTAFNGAGEKLASFVTTQGGCGFSDGPLMLGPDQTLYAGFGNGEFYSFNPPTSGFDIKWKFKAEDAFPGEPPSGDVIRLPSYIFSTPAVDTDGNIYFGAGNSKFYSLRPDGKTNWTFAAGAEIQASPAISADGTIYFGSGDHNFYALDLQGHEKWHYTAAGEIYGSPALAPAGTIYFGSRDSNLYALNPDGSLKWKFTTGGYVERPPVLGADGTIYFGSFDGYIYALNPDGTQKWKISTGQQTPAGALVGSLAIGSDGTIYAATGGDGEQLIAIRPNGEMAFSYRFGAVQIYSYSSAPAIGADGTIYVGAADKKVYAINPDGTLKWSTDTGSYGFSAANLSDDGLIYIGGGAMNLFVLNSNGEIVTNFVMSGPGMIGGTVSAPNLAPNHKLYIGSGNGKLYAFTTTGNLLASAWPTAQGNAQRTAQPPALVRDMAAASVGIDSIQFKVSIYDQSVAVEVSNDLKKWTTVPFTRSGTTVEVSRAEAAAFYRVRYGQ